MKKKITIFAFIVIAISVLWRIIFVCNGEILKNIVYKSDNLIIQQVQDGDKNLVIIGSGYSLCVDEKGKIINHDPFMVFPKNHYSDETVMSIFFSFDSKGLEIAGKELSNFINSTAEKYVSITLIGHSKCGVCFANSVKWIDCDNLNVVTVATPFQGTPIANKEIMAETLSWFDNFVYSIIFSNHGVDQDIIPNSYFIGNTDYSGLKNCTHINVISKCPEKSYNPIEIFLMYLNDMDV